MFIYISLRREIMFFRNKILREIEYSIRRFFAKKGKAKICGHEACSIGKLSNSILEFNGDELLYCHECLDKMTIYCAWCGRYIEIGDPIILLHECEEKTPNPVKYEEAYVACCRCADLGVADAQGTWVPSGQNDCKGRVERSLSIVEQLLCGGGDCAIMNSDGQNTQTKIFDREEEGFVERT